jgi:hypothetical protein
LFSRGLLGQEQAAGRSALNSESAVRIKGDPSIEADHFPSVY